jgi:hypothetical protein
MNLYLLICLLLIGYLIKVGTIVMGESHSNILNLIDYFKEKQIETLVDVLIIVSIAGVWKNTDLFANINSVWFAPFVSFLATKIWQMIAEKITGEKINGN